jgi:hypothetical protein
LTKIIEEDAFMVDFMLIDDSSNEIWQDRQLMDWEGTQLCVVSREGLIKLKKESDRHIDRADIENLERDGN